MRLNLSIMFFPPFDLLLIYLFIILLCSFVEFYPIPSFAWYLYISLQFSIWPKTHLLHFDIFISQKMQWPWNTSTTYNTLLTYMLFYVCFNYFYMLNSPVIIVTLQYLFTFTQICDTVCSWRIIFICDIFTFLLFHHILL